ncbi:helix-turn-helix transcriptional regulator [Proteiniclasticum sp. SCR006]|uniref:Helix-turn-helix transcriptional regulator n=1 Tax=Proteiniclasticum aestuarii TaxID=2817862 RepID=A0A939KGB2_9CLOT|nr:helix-turn-helix transcriptional regulator [Proteiniclasticum aestuarii]MBO1265332.1 helix-turn-helix transcriptional regulator [Proteiniclasticum aestuarii]
MTFSERLKNLRKERGVSQEELAKVLHITRQSISKWETGAAIPDMDKMRMLGDYYGLSLDELMDEDFSGRKEPDDVMDEDENQDDLEENLILGGFIIGIGLGFVTGNFLLGTAGGLIGLGLLYIMKAVKKMR